MGMRQRKCPLCKKWRRYEESVGDWYIIGHVKVCNWCAHHKRVETSDGTSGSNDGVEEALGTDQEVVPSDQ